MSTTANAPVVDPGICKVDPKNSDNFLVHLTASAASFLFDDIQRKGTALTHKVAGLCEFSTSEVIVSGKFLPGCMGASTFDAGGKIVKFAPDNLLRVTLLKDDGVREVVWENVMTQKLIPNPTNVLEGRFAIESIRPSSVARDLNLPDSPGPDGLFISAPKLMFASGISDMAKVGVVDPNRRGERLGIWFGKSDFVK